VALRLFFFFRRVAARRLGNAVSGGGAGAARATLTAAAADFGDEASDIQDPDRESGAGTGDDDEGLIAFGESEREYSSSGSDEDTAAAGTGGPELAALWAFSTRGDETNVFLLERHSDAVCLRAPGARRRGDRVCGQRTLRGRPVGQQRGHGRPQVQVPGSRGRRPASARGRVTWEPPRGLCCSKLCPESKHTF
jgi:hypothetical protein